MCVCVCVCVYIYIYIYMLLLLRSIFHVLTKTAALSSKLCHLADIYSTYVTVLTDKRRNFKSVEDTNPKMISRLI